MKKPLAPAKPNVARQMKDRDGAELAEGDVAYLPAKVVGPQLDGYVQVQLMTRGGTHRMEVRERFLRKTLESAVVAEAGAEADAALKRHEEKSAARLAARKEQ